MFWFELITVGCLGCFLIYLSRKQRADIKNVDLTTDWEKQFANYPDQYVHLNSDATEFWASCNPRLQPRRYLALCKFFGQNHEIIDNKTGTAYVVTKILPSPYWDEHPNEIPTYKCADPDKAIRFAVVPHISALEGLENLRVISISPTGPNTFSVFPNGSKFLNLLVQISEELKYQTAVSHSDAKKIMDVLTALKDPQQVSTYELIRLNQFLGKYSNLIQGLSLILTIIQPFIPTQSR